MRMIKKLFRILLIGLVSIIVLLVIIIGLLQTNWGQDYLREKSVAYLEKKLGTKVQIGKLSTNWLSRLEIDEVLLEDQSRQVLLRLGKLQLEYKLRNLFDHNISVSHLTVDSLFIRLSRSQSDSNYNFDYITKAFMGSPTTTKDDSKVVKSFLWQLGDINFKKISLLMDDKWDNQFYEIQTDTIFLSVRHVAPDKQEYFLKKLYASGLKVEVNSGLAHPSVSTTTVSDLLPFIKADTILLAGNILNIDMKELGFRLNSLTEEISTTGLNLDLNKNKLQLSKVNLKGDASKINLSAVPSTVNLDTAGNKKSNQPFLFSIDHFKFVHQQLKMDMPDKPSLAANQLDYNHLSLKNILLEADSIRYNGNAYTANLHQFFFADKSGFQVKKLQGNLQYTDQLLQLNKLVAETGNSKLEADVKLNYPSLEAIQKNPGLLNLNVVIPHVTIGKQDMAFLGVDKINDPYIKKFTTKDITMKGQITGSFNKLSLSNIQVNQSAMNLDFSGNINGLPDPKKLQAAISLNRLSGSRKDLEALLPPGTIPASISLPEQFLIKGKVSGKAEAINLDIVFNTSDGNGLLKGRITQLKGKEKFAYQIRAASGGLQLGKILMDTLYGNTHFDLVVNGRGVDPLLLNAGIEGKIPSIYFKGYDYQNIQVIGGLKHSLADIDFSINDTAVIASIKASYSLDSLHPMLKTDASIERLDLKRLGFTADTLIVKTKLQTDFTIVTPKHLNGELEVPFLELYKEGRNYRLDSTYLTAVNIDSLQRIDLEMPFAKLTMDGRYELDGLPEVTKQLLLNYLVKNREKTGVLPNCQADIKLQIVDHEMIHAIIPGLTKFKELTVNAALNTQKNLFDIEGSLPYLQYNDYAIDSSRLMISSEEDSLKISMVVNDVKFDPVNLPKAILNTTVKDGFFNWGINLFKSSDSINYQLKGNLLNDSAYWVMHLDEEQLLNGEKWAASTHNDIRVNKTSAGFHSDLVINAGAKQLAVKSAATGDGLPLVVELKDFSISTLTKLIETDTAIVDGKINGKAILQSFSPFRFTSNLGIDSIKTYGALIGNVNIIAMNDTVSKGYEANLLLSGNNNAAAVHLNYAADGEIAGDIQIDSLQLKILQPFLKAYFYGMEGKVKAALVVKGKLDQPVINGTLTAQDVKGVYTDYNTYFNLPEGKIDFSDEGLRLNNLVIKDSAGNTATVDGNLYTKNYLDYQYNLSVKTAHFLVASKKQRKDQSVYGPAWITSNIKIESKKEVMVVTGNVSVDEKSKINFEMDTDEITAATSAGIIEYYDSKKRTDSSVGIIVSKKAVVQKNLLKIALNLYLAINKKSSLKIILDKNGGDYLEAAGDANLTLAISKDGRINLLGEYQVESGEYILTLSEFIKRKFKLVNGGTIRWDGDPVNAILDLKALYNVTTSVEPLISGSQNIDKGSYKQKLPFDIYLMLKNEMTKPDISFKLDMAEKDQNAFDGIVYSRIKQINFEEAELNKQVMGLLVLNAFISLDPLASSATGFSVDVESAARSTAGKLMSQELNKIAGAIVKDFDINFDVNSKLDYSSGKKEGQTDLNIDISKSLFNDRTIVTIGSTIALEGSEAYKKETSGIAENASVEYKITRDGKYRVKVYKDNRYETGVQGQLIQTGLNFVIFVDFDKYKELFQSDKKTKKIKK